MYGERKPEQKDSVVCWNTACSLCDSVTMRCMNEKMCEDWKGSERIKATK